LVRFTISEHQFGPLKSKREINFRNKLDHVQPIKREQSFPEIKDKKTERSSCPKAWRVQP
jgi:hypothetical protein